MDAQTALTTRRSVRKFTAEPLTEAQKTTILKAAMQAPSGVNQQPWHFVLIDQRELLDQIAQKHPHASFARYAPWAILACADPALESHITGLWPQDLGAATQNILLSAHALGLGACWCGVVHRPELEKNMAELVGLPAGLRVFSLVVIGHPMQTPDPENRFKPERLHHNRW